MPLQIKNSASDQRTEKTSYMAEEILHMARDELAVCLPFFRQAAGSLALAKMQKGMGLGCDGETLYYDTAYVLRLFGGGRRKVNRALLHVLLHFLLLHFMEKERDCRLWSLACDMSVEYTIDHLDKPQIAEKKTPLREELWGALKQQSRYQNADSIYAFLLKSEYSESRLAAMEQEFWEDAHHYWMEEVTLSQLDGIRKKWEKILAASKKEAKGGDHNRGAQKGQEVEEITPQMQKRFDYRRFLKRFAVPREEVILDMDSFDYIYYYYGLQRYKNMPLIEPLEYKEMNKLEEMVIAIDTSGSCSRETVELFMGQTYEILSEKENFFRKMNVYVIQCDCYVQDVAHITCQEDWEAYMKHLRIQGRSGTDFRPVFTYVEQLRRKKRLRNLKGLFYFTDGDGIYPKEAPDYETAFVFLKEACLQQKVPAWATKLMVEVEK